LTSTISSRLPRLLPGTDLRGLPISPAEAFVVSRVDGATTVAEIAEETGKTVEEVSELLERLIGLGALALDEPTRVERRPTPPPPRPSGQFRLGPIVETTVNTDVKHPAAALYDPAELDESVEIDLGRRRQILDLYYKLDQLTHYELFDVDPSADKKAIKAAYFEVVNVFHPDRYFGKKVGSFKPKLEKVFARLSEAYDVLSRNQSRSEYDAYLRAQNRTRAFDAGQLDSGTHQAALQEVLRRIQAEASAESRSVSVPPPPPTPTVSEVGLGTPPSAEAPPRPRSNPALRPSASIRPSDPEIRRRALARKLGKAPPGTGPSPSPEAEAQQRAQQAQQDAQRKEWAADELKRRYQDRVAAARNRQLEVYTRTAQQALAKGDSIGAANALRIAVSLAPEDEASRRNLVKCRARPKPSWPGATSSRPNTRSATKSGWRRPSPTAGRSRAGLRLGSMSAWPTACSRAMATCARPEKWPKRRSCCSPSRRVSGLPWPVSTSKPG
jgi:curved DNA-binding protein CbpA